MVTGCTPRMRAPGWRTLTHFLPKPPHSPVHTSVSIEAATVDEVDTFLKCFC